MHALTHDNEAVLLTALALNAVEDMLLRLGDGLEGLPLDETSVTGRYISKQYNLALNKIQQAQKLYVLTIGLLSPKFADLAEKGCASG